MVGLGDPCKSLPTGLDWTVLFYSREEKPLSEQQTLSLTRKMPEVNSLASTVGRRSKSHSPNREIHRKHDKNFSENPVLDTTDRVGIRNSTGPHSHLHYSGIVHH